MEKRLFSWTRLHDAASEYVKQALHLSFLPFFADFFSSPVSISFGPAADRKRCLSRRVRLSLAKYLGCCAACLVSAGRAPRQTSTCLLCSCSGTRPCPRSVCSCSRSSLASAPGSSPSSARFSVCQKVSSLRGPAQTQWSLCSTLPDSCPCCSSALDWALSAHRRLGFVAA